jgi:hypothetical protein
MGRAADMQADIDGTLTFDRVPSATRMAGACGRMGPPACWRR